MADLFHVVLHQPEIPNNTGNIGRTCVALGCSLHLVRPLGFDTSEHALRRAGLDYWPRLGVRKHDDWDTCLRALEAAQGRPPRLWLYTTKASRSHWDADLHRGDVLVFGRETAGLPDDLLRAHPDRLLTIPILPHERSLNLATAVCAALCEGVRQCAARNELTLRDDGRIDPDAFSSYPT